MAPRLQTKLHLEFLNLGCKGLSESTRVKMPHFRKSHVTAQFMFGTLQVTVTGTGIIDTKRLFCVMTCQSCVGPIIVPGIKCHSTNYTLVDDSAFTLRFLCFDICNKLKF